MPDKSNAAKGVAAMIAATALLTLNDAIAKSLSETYPVGQILFWRQLIGAFLLLAVLLMRREVAQLRIVDGKGQLVRGLLFVANTFLIVASLSLLPLPIVSSILFTSPIIIAVLSGPLLGETVTARRWLAVAIGFAGMLVIVRPGSAAASWLMLLPVVPAFVSSLRDIVTRKLTRTETSLSILFWSNALIVPAGLLTWAFGSAWQPLNAKVVGWLVFNGAINLAAHFLMIHALRIADASLVAPFKYTGLIWAFLLGFAIWHFVPDIWTLAGALLIVVSGMIALERSSRRTARDVTAPAPEALRKAAT